MSLGVKPDSMLVVYYPVIAYDYCVSYFTDWTGSVVELRAAEAGT